MIIWRLLAVKMKILDFAKNIDCGYMLSSLEASVVQWLYHSPCKPRVAGLIPGFSSPSDGTINRGPVSI